MHRSLALVGVVLVIGAILAVAIPFLVTSAFLDGDAFYGAGLVFLLGVVLLLRGATAPDPTVTTVGGFLGNPVVDESRRAEEALLSPAARHVRYAPGPREPVNCRHCYTIIPWDVVDCPRCARPRECRSCGKRLYFLAGAVRCAPCVRDETYCNCPRVRPSGVRPSGARRLGGGA
ncbi:MAG: hypothetical protein L3K14_08035 [Thermoplasmata archaeon]|nr:hypothetical protein [Thermoplasmata archaeon]